MSFKTSEFKLPIHTLFVEPHSQDEMSVSLRHLISNLLQQNQLFEKQNQLLVQQNQMFEEQNQMFEEQNQMLVKENSKLNAQLVDLEEQLNTNSRNSSKPPSQDPFHRSRHSQLSVKKPGGQPGHPKHMRKMIPLDEVSRIVEIKPKNCLRCGVDVLDDHLTLIKQHQVVELCGVNPDVTHYNVYKCRCHVCGKKIKGELPKEAKGCFGSRLMAFVTMLCAEANVTKRKICAIVNHLGIQVSLGAVCNIHQLAGNLLDKPFEEIRTAVLRSSNINADETSWKYKQNKCWLWIGATPIATFFSIHSSRSQKAFESIFDGFCNTLTSDRYGAYNLYLGKKQTCLAHIRRDFIKMSDRLNADGAIGRILLDQLDLIFSLWKQFKTQKISRSELHQQAQDVIENIKTALTCGVVSEGLKSKTVACCKNLLNRFETLWVFLFHEGVEPTNNLAERGLRPAVIYRKLTGGSQSIWGMTFVERLLTVACTFRQQTKNIYAFLIDTFKEHRFGRPAPPVFNL